ncbi:peptidoglycan DD-metalloendopeptidase family protein [Celerinatantimonas sp. YJH-8]|uniref:peptidoglycan DD-metalloendopeptidase family protein n=1 Tax=Celerinatantimonas sp. YJH-8 TaxID=3228714 RepID=UPI0038CBFD7B
MSIQQVAAINHLQKPYTIYPGQRIRLHWPASKTAIKTPPSSVKTTKKREPVEIKNRSRLVSRKSNEYAKRALEKKTLEKNSRGATISHWMWPTTGRLISGFSSRVTGNKGIDIAGKRNQAIHSAAAGRVVYAGNALRGYGNLIIIKHNDDYLSAYAHNSRILVKEHQTVKAGQHIADMGETGTVSVRLHFEIRYKGKSVDPLRYLPKH